MDGLTLLREARAAGLSVTQRPDGGLSVKGPRRAEALARRLLSRKTEVVAALRELPSVRPGRDDFVGSRAGTPPADTLAPQRSEALGIWEEALHAVSARWKEATLTRRAGKTEPPRLPPSVDEALEAEVADAIRAGNVDETSRRAAAWRHAWEEAIAGDETRNLLETAETRGFCPGGQPTELVPELRARLEARARRLGGGALFDLVHSDDLAAAEREVYRAELYARADEMVAESAGGGERANQSVRDVISGASRNPRGSATDFEPETLALRARVQALVDSGEIDGVEPFELRQGVRVVEPRKMAQALLRDLDRPDSARCRNGVAQRDLRALFERVAAERSISAMRAANARGPDS